VGGSRRISRRPSVDLPPQPRGSPRRQYGGTQQFRGSRSLQVLCSSVTLGGVSHAGTDSC
jgi:hypothetical protein